MASGRRVRVLGCVASGALALLASCTTVVQPAACTPGSTSCAGVHDARFCEYVAVETEGADCASTHILRSKPFCVVTPGACNSATYAVMNRDCRVVRYETVRDDDRAECAPGTPMFVSR